VANATFNFLANLTATQCSLHRVTGVPVRYLYLFDDILHSNLIIQFWEVTPTYTKHVIEIDRWHECVGTRRILIKLLDFDYSINPFHYKSLSTLNNLTHYYPIGSSDDESSDSSVSLDRLNLTPQSGFIDDIKFQLMLRDKEYILKLIEDLAILLRGLYKSYHNDFDLSIIIEYSTIFWKLRNNKSLINQLSTSGIIDYLKFILKDSSDEMVEQSSHPIFESARHVLNNVHKIKDSKVYITIYRVGMYILTNSIFESSEMILDKCGYNKFEIKNLSKKFKLSGNLLLDLADGIIFLLEKGYQIITTGSLDCIYHTDDEYAALFDTIQDLKLKQHALANPEALGFSEAWYIRTLDDTIEKLKSVIKLATLSKSSETKVLKHYLYDMERIKIDRVLKLTVQSYRETPFSLLFFAPPGIGKTSLLKIVFQHFGVTHNLPTDDSFMFTRNSLANFADGFTTPCWCWVQDDIAFLHPDKVVGCDPTLSETIQLRNSVQFTPDQAAIEDKGKAPFRGKLLLGTTNVEHLNAYYYFSCPSALQRRYPFVVEASVKPEYCIPGTKMLDASKTALVDGEYPNYWRIIVSKVKIPERRHDLAKKETVLVTDNINDFLAWLSKISIEHFENEKKMTTSFAHIKKVEVCKICFRSVKFCSCAQLTAQSGYYSFYDKICTTTENIYVYTIHFCFIFANTFTTVMFYLYLRHLVSYWLIRLGYHAVNVKVDKAMFVSISQRARQTVGHNKKFTLLLGAITTWYALFKVSSYFKLEVQSATETKPISLEKERHNPWIISDFRLCSLDLTQPILSSKNQSNDDFEAMVLRNICVAFIPLKTARGRRYTNILCLKNNIYVANAHWFDVLEEDTKRIEICVLNDLDGPGVIPKISFMLNISDVKLLPNCDLVVFEVPHVVPKKDLTAYFPSCKVDLYFNGILLGRKIKGDVFKMSVNNVKLQRHKDEMTKRPFDNMITFGTSQYLTQEGDCGSPLIAHTPKGHMIVSLHRAGTRNRDVLGTCLFKEHIEEILNTFEHSSVGDAPPYIHEKHLPLLKLHSKSVFNYIESGTAEVYGSLSGFKTAHKSRVCPTIMRPFFLKNGYSVNYVKPNLGGWQPWRIAATDLVSPVVAFDVALVRACAMSYCDTIVKRIGKDHISEIVHKYDQFTAINGAPGVAYVDKINRTTSAGYPYYKQKRHFLIDLPPQHGLDEPVGINEELQSRVDAVRERYNQGLRYKPIFVASLKDEPITPEKAALGKIRVFGSAPVDWIIVVRQYLLSFVRLMQNNKFDFECAIGTVAQSGEWSELYNFITLHGEDTIVAGDFKKFDKQMSPVFIQAAFSVISAICQLSGNYDDQDIAAIKAIGVDTAFPLMDFNGDLVQFYGSNPSGHSLTVVINSIVNSIYMRYVFVQLFYKNNDTQLSPIEVLSLFRANVSLLTYGDDNIMGVDKTIPWFNHTSISKVFGEMGIGYTMADKSAESVPYIHISQASFLKRTWVLNKTLGYHFAPLDHDSIEKMLTTWVASDSISSEHQCISVLASAIREYFFYGKEIYNEKLELFKKLVTHLKLEPFVVKSTLPPYNILEARYMVNTSRILGVDVDDRFQRLLDSDTEVKFDITSFAFRSSDQ